MGMGMGKGKGKGGKGGGEGGEAADGKKTEGKKGCCASDAKKGKGKGKGKGKFGPPPPMIEEVTTPTLTGLDFAVDEGTLTCVVGPIGSGKSSLLAGLLAEMNVSKTDESKDIFGYCLKGSTAYLAQSAWIQNLTVRENILFGMPYDADKYNRIVEACALGPDLQILRGGDAAEIGEAGKFSGASRHHEVV
jgi:ABC-type multidrug transport system fused ATPase/permease subunit